MTAAANLKHRLPAEIATARLLLATPAMAHIPEMAQLANNRAIFEVLARLPHPYAEEDGRVFVTEIARGETEFAWSILENDRFVGVMGFHLLPGQEPELGYWLGEPHWGRGIATEAARAVVAAARTAGATKLKSRALAHNSGSRNVLRKAGFTETHEAIDGVGNCAGKPTVYMEMDLSR
jgi:RimJ/RimL family protein N-acetyltransferase